MLLQYGKHRLNSTSSQSSVLPAVAIWPVGQSSHHTDRIIIFSVSASTSISVYQRLGTTNNSPL